MSKSTVSMHYVIEKVSQAYRSRLNELSHLKKEHTLTVQLISEARIQRGENLTHAEYMQLEKDQKFLEQKIFDLEKFCAGFEAAREVLMDLGFDTEVEV